MNWAIRAVLLVLTLTVGGAKATTINVLNAWQAGTIGQASILGSTDAAIISRMYQEFITINQALANSHINNFNIAYVGP